MVSIDDLVKIVLVLSVAFSMVGISFQLIRLIGKLVDVLEDSRTALKNVNDLSTFALQDYVEARGVIKEVLAGLTSFKGMLSNPLGFAAKAIKDIRNFTSKESEE